MIIPLSVHCEDCTWLSRLLFSKDGSHAWSCAGLPARFSTRMPGAGGTLGPSTPGRISVAATRQPSPAFTPPAARVEYRCCSSGAAPSQLGTPVAAALGHRRLYRGSPCWAGAQAPFFPLGTKPGSKRSPARQCTVSRCLCVACRWRLSPPKPVTRGGKRYAVTRCGASSTPPPSHHGGRNMGSFPATRRAPSRRGALWPCMLACGKGSR